jgi:hypothetical protein
MSGQVHRAECPYWMPVVRHLGHDVRGVSDVGQTGPRDRGDCTGLGRAWRCTAAPVWSPAQRGDTNLAGPRPRIGWRWCGSTCRRSSNARKNTGLRCRSSRSTTSRACFGAGTSSSRSDAGMAIAFTSPSALTAMIAKPSPGSPQTGPSMVSTSATWSRAASKHASRRRQHLDRSSGSRELVQIACVDGVRSRALGQLHENGRGLSPKPASDVSDRLSRTPPSPDLFVLRRGKRSSCGSHRVDAFYTIPCRDLHVASTG